MVVVVVMVAMSIAAVSMPVVRHFGGDPIRSRLGCGRLDATSMSSHRRPSNAAPLASEENEGKGKELEGRASVVAEPLLDFKVWNPPAGDAVVSSPGARSQVALSRATC